MVPVVQLALARVIRLQPPKHLAPSSCLLVLQRRAEKEAL